MINISEENIKGKMPSRNKSKTISKNNWGAANINKKHKQIQLKHNAYALATQNINIHT